MARTLKTDEQTSGLQDKPYALFGTCLGAIVAYEIARRVQERKHAPMPVAFFPAAVSAPHLYAIAVMKLYVQHQVGAATCQDIQRDFRRVS
jgi:surfactin synthase thioesterase subunit